LPGSIHCFVVGPFALPMFIIFRHFELLKILKFEIMKKLLFMFSCLFILSFPVQGQAYKTGIGVRGGLSNGITIKQHLSNDVALELLAATRWKGYNFTLLYEVHNNLGDAPGLRWYYGAGGHIGYWHGYKGHPWFKDDEDYRVIGVDLILGIEYTFKEAPINISADYKPAYNLTGYNGFWGDEGALSLRIVF
jgi:hypothetical protein